MPQQPPRLQTADAPLRPRLVLGWGLFFVFVLVGAVFALWRGGAIPVLLDVPSP